MTKDEQIKRQMGQCYCLSKIRSYRSAQKLCRWNHLGSANAERPLEVPNDPRKLTKPMRGPAHKYVGIHLPISIVLLKCELQQVLGDMERGGVLASCHVIRPACGVRALDSICPLAGRTKCEHGQSFPKPQMLLPPSTQTPSSQEGTAIRARCANALAHRRDWIAAPNLSAREASLPLRHNAPETPERLGSNSRSPSQPG